jgi:hypothetical protein
MIPTMQNPAGTLPTLEADGQVYTSTAEVIRALIKDAPVKVKDGSAIMETFHQDKYDPNFALILTVCVHQFTLNNNTYYISAMTPS